MHIFDRVDKLLANRGIAGHRAAERFVMDFKAYLSYFERFGYGKLEDTVALLEDDSNLTDNSILNTNFRCKLNDLISPVLQADKIFMKTFGIVIDNNGKGVGAGELALPLILSNYRFSNKNDGEFYYNGETRKVEIKKSGASLKPVKTGLTDKGLVDVLNKKYFKDNPPGYKSSTLFAKHLNSVSDPTVYAQYFNELYVGCDTSELIEEVIAGAYKDPTEFNSAVGKFALKEYKRVDNFNNIIYIDIEKSHVVNICDVNNVDNLGLKFTPKFKRGGDTQAIPDGYVNVSI
jgi:hypothetical protein